MTKTKSTKHALLMSGLALLVCVSMLIGSTFAWFTDSVTSGRNIIQSGTLDAKLSFSTWDEATNTWSDYQEVTSDTVVFGKGAKYEPGYTEVVKFKVENLGSLAFKYQLGMRVFKETPSTNVYGDEFYLSDYIKVGSMDAEFDGWSVDRATAAEYATMDIEEATNLAVVPSPFGGFLPDCTLQPAGSFSHGVPQDIDEWAFVIHMPTTVGNEANHKSDVEAPSIEFAVNLIATQFTYESDSFGNKYDADAKYPIVIDAEIDSSMSFEEISEIFAEGGNVLVTEDVTVANPENSRFTEFELKSNMGLYFAEGAQLTFAETTTLIGNGKLTVYEGSIVENQELCVAGNATLVFEGGEHSFADFSVSRNGTIIVNGGILNCRDTYASILGICFAENGKLIVNGGTLNMYQPFNLNPNRCDAAYIEINGGTIDLLNGIENLFVVRNIMDKDREEGGVLRGSSIRVNGGTFIAHYEIDSAGDATSFIRNSDAPADTNKVLVSNAADGYDCIVTGGTFYGSWQRADNQRYTNGNGGYSDGKFVENSIAGFVADGYEIIGDATNGYIVTAK